MPEPARPPTPPVTARGADNGVDRSLLDWYRELSLSERLRVASQAAATLDRLARAAAKNR